MSGQQLHRPYQNIQTRRRLLESYCRVIWLVLGVLVTLTVGATAQLRAAGTQEGVLGEECVHDGNVDQIGGLTPNDAVLALQYYLGAVPLGLQCQPQQANVVAPDTSPVTPADARCIFQRFLELRSCINRPPLANATGPDTPVVAGAPVVLDASGSMDPDEDVLTYMWTQTGGPPVNLAGADSAQPSFTAPAAARELTAEPLQFEVQVTDTGGLSDSASVTIVHLAPGDDVGNTFATAPPLTLDSSTAGTVQAGGDVDVFRLDVSVNGEITVHTTGGTDTLGRLFNAAGELIAERDDIDVDTDRNFAIFVGVLPAGTYFVAVSGFNASTSGSYTLEVSFDPSPAGMAAGRLIVPPYQTMEVEPNNSIVQAQSLPVPATIAGAAALQDVGFPVANFLAAEAKDLYRLQTQSATRIQLVIAEDELVRNGLSVNDLDLVLMDTAGNVLDVSEGQIATEVVETPGAGEFLVGVGVFAGASAYVLSLTPLAAIGNATDAWIDPEADFVPGEILLKMQPDRPGFSAQATRLTTAYDLTPVASLPPGVELLRLTSSPRILSQATQDVKPLGPDPNNNRLKALTLDTVRRLRLDPAVVYAEPNFIRYPLLVPDDPFYPLQWHYELLNLPEAWDITIGSDEVTVAVIDTGVLVNHPDLRDRLVPGYDFISDATNANDGNGRDPDPGDPGDDPRRLSSSFHGTHVTGTVGATTNNSFGVAGVTWQTRLMPLRVLGTLGGTDADIAQAIRYAARLPNVSGTLPDERAQIINMSLGGPSSPDPQSNRTLQDAIDAARAEGVVVVAAAGNDNSSAFFVPAALRGVIAVAAVDMNSQKAPYSNFGSNIDVAAPGGDTRVDRDGDGFGDGVLSTLGTDQGEFTFRFYQGTSMASPHVAGVLALMFAVNPSLTPSDIDELLRGTHAAAPGMRITRDLGQPGRDDMFGYGLIDAVAAVIAANAIPGGNAVSPADSILAVSTVGLNFGNFLTNMTFEVSNAGDSAVPLQVTITDDAPWLTVTPADGAAPFTLTAIADRTGLAEGQYLATIQIASNATQGETMATIAVTLQVGGNALGNIGPVFVLVLDSESFAVVAQVITDAAHNYDFTIPPILAGSYLIVAGTDRDNDEFICDIEDACGGLEMPITVRTDEEITDIHFVVGEMVAPQTAGTSRFYRKYRRLSSNGP